MHTQKKSTKKEKESRKLDTQEKSTKKEKESKAVDTQKKAAKKENHAVRQHVCHTFEPVWDTNSRVLILGTFPSVKSRENHFYYGHPQNRFWKMIAQITKSKLPETIEEKKKLLLTNHIAIWDVIASCDIIGSSDSSITDVVPNDIAGLLADTNIQTILANGKKAAELYNRYIYPQTKLPIVTMPSTSPANAAWSLDRLCAEYRKYTFTTFP